MESRHLGSLKVSTGCKPEEKAENPHRFSRVRAFVLIGVYLLVGAHILHWKWSGKTLAPLEFNEATLGFDQGLITAGFIFMGLALVSTIVFGRFFCGWACHILALQDFCAFLLKKIGIRPKPFRSRVLYLLPLCILLYMFFWTPFRRLTFALFPSLGAFLGQPDSFQLRMAVEGPDAAMGSLITSDFWRNLPGPGIMLLTFLICGFLVIYFLGSRSFCTYVCPYGAFFKWTDRLSPAKIKLTGDCTACGKCSAACKSGINVMHEVRTFHKVVDTACFKDQDCVAACPEQALSFGFTMPTLVTREKPRAKPFPLKTLEEIALLMVFLFCLLVFLGLPESMAPWAGRLYGLMPLFLSATLSVLTAFLALMAFRLLRNSEIVFQGVVLKKNSRTMAGNFFLALTGVWFLFLGHSATIQYHMFLAGHAIQDLQISMVQDSAQTQQVSLSGESHLLKASQWEFFYQDRRIARQRAFLALSRGDWEMCAVQLRKAVQQQPEHPDSKFQLGWVLAGMGKIQEGLTELNQTDSLSPPHGRFKGAVWKGVVQLIHRKQETQALELLQMALVANPQDSVLASKAKQLLPE